MKRIFAHALIIAVGLALSAPVYSAAYIKLGDIKGESKSSSQLEPAREIKSDETPKPAALLLPAVQKAREAGASGIGKKGKVETQWKVEEGSK
ncbi:MAG: hypothetical protein RRB22_00050 [Gammaproteobacteria bacterium]|nr:hypothetical protein [Gammaproteobacteria bacterium]